MRKHIGPVDAETSLVNRDLKIMRTLPNTPLACTVLQSLELILLCLSTKYVESCGHNIAICIFAISFFSKPHGTHPMDLSCSLDDADEFKPYD